MARRRSPQGMGRMTWSIGGILIGGLLASGCASVYVARGEQPHVGRVPIPSDPVRPSVVLDLSDAVYRTRAGWLIEFGQIAERVTEEAALFSRFAVSPGDEPMTPQADYRIRMSLHIAEGEIGKLYGGLIVSSLGALPAVRTDRIRLSATVMDRADHLVKDYELSDAMTEITHPVGLLLYPFARSPETVATGIVENMIKVLYQRMLDDGLLRPQGGTP